MKKLICLTALLTCLNASGQCYSLPTPPGNSQILTIDNQKNCPVVVNYEVSQNCSINYCNSFAQFPTTTTFVIPANSTFSVDVSVQHYCLGCPAPLLTHGICTFYDPTVAPPGTTYDLLVGLFVIDGSPPATPFTIYGAVSAGNCCFSSGPNASGPPNGSTTCSSSWFMQWSYSPASGVLVQIL